MKVSLRFISIFPLFFLLACSIPEIREAEPLLNPVKKNQVFCIALMEDHSQGETWQMVKDVNSSAFENLGSNWHGIKKGVKFNLKALKSGIYIITFRKTRLSEFAGEKRFLIQVQEE